MFRSRGSYLSAIGEVNRARAWRQCQTDRAEMISERPLRFLHAASDTSQ